MNIHITFTGFEYECVEEVKSVFFLPALWIPLPLSLSIASFILFSRFVRLNKIIYLFLIYW